MTLSKGRKREMREEPLPKFIQRLKKNAWDERKKSYHPYGFYLFGRDGDGKRIIECLEELEHLKRLSGSLEND